MNDRGAMKVVCVVGTRPNFMKIAPIILEMTRAQSDAQALLVHTGQHYDDNMSDVFFRELEIRQPDVNLDVRSSSHSRQTAEIMLGFEPVLRDYQPDWVLVPGDVNSTLACALVAAKLGIKVAHVEAGLRSFDRLMPEEINRLLTDQISDLLFTPSRDASANLFREGIDPSRVCFVGNVMIDTLVRLLPKTSTRWPALRTQYGLVSFALVTLHRPSNVDAPGALSKVMDGLSRVAAEIPVLFPVHPRTRSRLAELRLESVTPNLRLVEPPGYLDFLTLEANASVVLTDSGGIQEEASFLGIPCLTLRPNTERPITISEGTNRLVRAEPDAMLRAVREALVRPDHAASRPELWDGRTAERILAVLKGTSAE